MKTKFQKQDEALARKRARIPELRKTYLDWMQGGTLYENCKERHGENYAWDRSREEIKKFMAACDEARVDTHGNPTK